MTPRRLRGSVRASSSITATVIGPHALRLVRPFGHTSPSPADQLRALPAMMPSSRELQRRYGLTPREADVALEIVGGGQNRDVADRLGLSLHTVRRHVERVLFKLQVHSRSSVLPTLLSDSARRSAS